LTKQLETCFVSNNIKPQLHRNRKWVVYKCAAAFDLLKQQIAPLSTFSPQ